MFPDIIREDIFRLETRRLWLRWPVLADASDAAGFLGSDSTPESASGDPFAAARILAEIATAASILADWRTGNAAGTHLSLVLTGRGPDRRSIGAIGLAPLRDSIDQCGLRLRAWLDPKAAGQGLGTEAVQAMVDIAFMLTATPRLSRRPRACSIPASAAFSRNAASRPAERVSTRRPMDGASRRRTGSVSIAKPGAASRTGGFPVSYAIDRRPSRLQPAPEIPERGVRAT